MTDWIKDLRVVDLKDELRKRDLAVSGKKQELVDRLLEAVNQEAVTKEANAAGAEKEDVDPENGLPESVAEPINEEEANGTAQAASTEVPTSIEGTKTNEIQIIESGPEAEPLQTDKLVDVQLVDEPVATVTEEQTAPILTEVLSQPEAIKEDIVSEPEVIQTEVVIQIPPENAEKQDDVKAVEKAAKVSGITPDIPGSVVSNEAVPTLQPHIEAALEDKIPAQSSGVVSDNGNAFPSQRLTSSGANAATEVQVSDIAAGTEAHKDQEPGEVPPDESTLSEAKQEPNLQNADQEALDASENAQADTEMTEPGEATDNLAAMQAALLESAKPVEAPADEEELVDFDADEVMEEPTSTKAQAASRVVKAAAEEPASISTKTAEKVILEPKQEGDAPSTKRKRQPIPSFASMEKQRSGIRAETPGKTPSENLTSETRKSVFARVGGLGEETARGPGAPPSRVQATTALLVAGFVRPFTVKAAQALFEAHGKVTEFWMPPRRDNAYVVFETLEAAEAARQAVHALEWPAGSRTSLRPKFVPEEEVLKTISTDGKNLPARGSGLGNRGSGLAKTAITNAVEDAQRPPAEKRKSDKVDGEPDAKKVKAEPVKAKDATLEELFRATETRPKLYWLPLSDEKIAAKQKLKASHEASKTAVQQGENAQRETASNQEPPAKEAAKKDSKIDPDTRVKEERQKQDRHRDARSDRHREERPREYRSSKRD